MKTIKVKHLMVPIAECPRVPQDATIRDAVLELEASRSRGDPWDYRPRVILVLDGDDNIVGTLRQFEILKALEPRYDQVSRNMEPRFRQVLEYLGAKEERANEIKMLFCMVQYLGLVRSIMDDYGLWAESLADLCQKAAGVKVTDIMSVPGDMDMIDQEALLGEALHKMLVGSQQSLIVTVEGQSVGIVRLINIFNEICSAIKLSNGQKP